MKITEKDTKSAPCAWWAAQDARMRNIANKSQWSQDVHLTVDRMMVALDFLYAGKIYEAYNKKRVSIKIDKPVVKDRKWLKDLEADWAARGITKTVTPQGILYRVA
jgi:hypothetical protein